ncbi:MAG: ATP-binding protein [Rickettsiales bacterium]|nr:ATP-binding protein [Rickettsiales bacterium]
MIKNIIVVGSGKGGVGKSTVSINLSVAISKLKKCSVGLLDADIYGPSIPKMLGIKDKPVMSSNKKIIPYEKFGIKSMSIGNMIPEDNAVIWRGVMASNAIKQFLRDVDWGNLDYLIIDLPPGTGDIHLSLCQSLSIRGAVVVSSPQEISLIDVRKAIGMFEKVNVPVLGLIQNFSYLKIKNEQKNYIFGKDGVIKEAKRKNIKFLGEIPIIPEISSLSDQGIPASYDEKNNVFIFFKEISKRLFDSLGSIKQQDVKIES